MCTWHNPVHIFMRPHSIFLLRNDVSQNSAASQTFFWQQLPIWKTAVPPCETHRHTLKINLKLYRRISNEATRARTSKTTCDLLKKIVTFLAHARFPFFWSCPWLLLYNCLGELALTFHERHVKRPLRPAAEQVSSGAPTPVCSELLARKVCWASHGQQPPRLIWVGWGCRKARSGKYFQKFLFASLSSFRCLIHNYTCTPVYTLILR